MDAYYQQQSQLAHFGGAIRQRGSGIGALVAGIGRVALPFIRRVIIPTAKRIGRDLISQAIPEAIEVLSQRKTPKQALKQKITNTVRKQVGAGKRKRRRSVRVQAATTRKAPVPANSVAKRSRLSFFSNVNNDY